MDGKSGGRLGSAGFEEEDEEDGAVWRKGAAEGKNQSRWTSGGGGAASPSTDILVTDPIGGALWEFAPHTFLCTVIG